jgi:tRNA uridine 5-carbamoylmethylation protein Kti12
VMILEYSSLVFGLAKEFCGTLKNLQPLKTEYITKINKRVQILDFKLSPCFEYCMNSFGCFPSVRL